MFKNLFVHQNKYIQKKQRVGRNIYDEEYSVTGWTLDSKTIFFFSSHICKGATVTVLSLLLSWLHEAW